MDYVSETAQALGLSKSTVYKALSRDKLVSYRTRTLVLDYVSEHYPEQLAARMSPKEQGNKVIAVIMPYKPSYFWDIAAKGIADAAHLDYRRSTRLTLKYIFYSSNFSENELLSMLDEVENDLPDALAIVPINTPLVAERLNAIVKKIPVVLFCDFCDGCGGLVTVMPDAYNEGLTIGQMMAGSVRENGKILFLKPGINSKISDERILGAMRGVEAAGKNIKISVEDIMIDSESSLDEKYVYNTIYPSILARTIDRHIREKSDVEAVYVPNGFLYPLFQALKKLGRTDMRTFGHESNSKIRAFYDSGLRGGYVCQNIYAEAMITIDILAGILLDGAPYTLKTHKAGFDTYRFL